MKQELMVDSLEEFRTEGNFNYYYSYHIDKIESVIDLGKLEEMVKAKVREFEMQMEKSITRWKGIPENIQKECEAIEDLEELKNNIQGINPLIKVRVRR